MSLGIFCLLFSSVDYVPVKGEIILSLTTWLISLSIMLSSSNQKLWYIYRIEFYAAERKKELIPFVTAWMELQKEFIKNT